MTGISVFDEVIERRGTNSYKWDTNAHSEVLPMWVADMDFRTAPCVVEALTRRVAQGVFGYSFPPKAYFDAVVGWFKMNYQWEMNPDWIVPTTGVVPAISAVIKATTRPGDAVLLMTPVYNCFFSSIRNNGCKQIDSTLRQVNGRYEVDWEDFERKAALPEVKVFLLCNPHNPVGRVWSTEELKRMGDICIKNNVFVLADEIHCDLVLAGNGVHFHPFASLGEVYAQHSATCSSPSKTFNIAGLQVANISVPDAEVRAKVNRAINDNEVCDLSPLAIEALIAAYGKGFHWVYALVDYLTANYNTICDYISEQIPQLKVVQSEGTYLAWVDVSAVTDDVDAFVKRLETDYFVRFNSGKMYGKEGEGFIRINFACPNHSLMEGLNKLRMAVNEMAKAHG